MQRKASGAHTGTGASLCGCGGPQGKAGAKLTEQRPKEKLRRQRAEGTRREQIRSAVRERPPPPSD